MPKGKSIRGQSRETGNIWYTKRKQKHNTIRVGHHCTQTNTNNVNKKCAPPPLQKTGGKVEPSSLYFFQSEQSILDKYNRDIACLVTEQLSF
jgi:hypothetical protein